MGDRIFYNVIPKGILVIIRYCYSINITSLRDYPVMDKIFVATINITRQNPFRDDINLHLRQPLNDI
jgi:hypothetical protein